MRYSELIGQIEEGLNDNSRGRQAKQKNQNILNCLIELKRDFGTELSTFYLRNLVKSEDSRKKTLKVSNFLRSVGLNVKTDFIIYLDDHDAIIKKDVLEYGFNKWNEPVLKNIRCQEVKKTFKNWRSRQFKFIELEF